MPDLVKQQNERLRILEYKLLSGDTSAATTPANPALAAQMAEREELQRVAERDQLFGSSMYEIERTMMSFVTPTQIYRRSADASDGSAGAKVGAGVRTSRSSGALARQRASSERLFQGDGVKVSKLAALPARLVLPPTGKRLNLELAALRSDPKALEELKLRCQQHHTDMQNEKVAMAKGHGEGAGGGRPASSTLRSP